MGTKKSAKIPPLGPRWSDPFDDYPGFSSWGLGSKVTGQVLFLNTQYNKIAQKWMLLMLSSYIDAIIHVYYWKVPFVLVYLVLDVEALSPALQVWKILHW